MKSITKDKKTTGDKFSYKWASLEAIVMAVEDELLEYNLMISAEVNMIEYTNHIQDVLIIKIRHKSTQWIATAYPLNVDPKKAASNSNQAYGESQTYAMRYGIRNLLGLAISDETDNDCSTEEEAPKTQYTPNPNKPISDKQKGAILKIYDADQIDKFCKLFKVNSINELNSAQASQLISKSKEDE